MLILPLAGREEYEPPRLAISVAERGGAFERTRNWPFRKPIPAGPLWVRKNFQTQKASAPEGGGSLILGMRGMMSVSSATGYAVSWFPIGLMRKEHAA